MIPSKCCAIYLHTPERPRDDLGRGNLAVQTTQVEPDHLDTTLHPYVA